MDRGPPARNGQRLEHREAQQGQTLGRLGWSLRRIQEATGVRRETASAYLKEAGIAARVPGRWGHDPPKPAIEVITGSEAKPAIEVITGCAPRGPSRSPSTSACEIHRDTIEAAVERGRNAMAIYQDLVSDHGFAGGYASVMRFVRRLRQGQPPDAHVAIETSPGQESQVDYGEGPMVRCPETGKYRRTRLFVLTLAHSRKAVQGASARGSARCWI